MKKLISVLACGVALASVTVGATGLGQSTPPTVGFVETSSPALPQYRQCVSGAWGAQASAASASSPVDWQVLRTCPKRDELAMLTSSDDLGLRLQVWNGTSWGAPSTLATDCGTIQRRAFDAEYEQVTGRLIAVYREGTSTSLYYRADATAGPPEQVYAPGLSGAPSWIKLASKPLADEVVMIVAAGSNLYAAVWNGSAWGNFTTLSTTLPSTGRPYNVAYSRQTGKALVVWGKAATSSPQYATWNGASWSAPASAPTLGGGTPTMIRMATNPLASSDEVLMAVTDSARHINVCNWTGSAWGAMTTIETSVADATQRRVDLAYQPDGTRALVVWHTSGQNAVRYRTWSGAAWSAALIGPDMGTETQMLCMAPGHDDTEIIVGAKCHSGSASISDYLVYSSGGIVSLTGTVNGPTGDQVAGVTPPPPPGNAAGAVPLTVAGGATVTVTPGAYAALNTGNTSTLNFSAGTYVFTQWLSSKDFDTFACNTSAGDVNIIFTTGGVLVHDNFNVTNTGGGQVVIQLVNGNFQDHDHVTMQDTSLLVYNGYIDFHDASSAGFMYASGNITNHNAGTFNFPSGNVSAPYAGNPSRLLVMRWTAGAFGGPSVFSSLIPGWLQRDSVDISRPSMGGLWITRWREVGQDE